jgi:hypothetical protein
MLLPIMPVDEVRRVLVEAVGYVHQTSQPTVLLLKESHLGMPKASLSLMLPNLTLTRIINI